MANQISLPEKISIIDQKDHRYQVVIEPFYPGFGVTIGNALRRVLLSALSGAAVTSFKIDGVQHEFGAVQGIKEDVVEIALNLKKLRVRVFSDEPVKIKLHGKGETVLTGADIEKNSDVEVLNKDMVIATLTDKNSTLNMELVVEKGLGYVTVEQREKEKLEIGTIAIDASFSPVLNVGYEIKHVRVGKMTNYEQLTLDLTTDGTITVDEAIAQASQILAEHFSLWSTATEPVKAKKTKAKKEEETEANIEAEIE